MDTSTAQRRLVKSPPELWAELSDETTLARHLAEFGEIRITRAEPETTVAWEGDRASGTVEIEPAGWGTKVVLTAVPVVQEIDVEPRAPVEEETVAEEPKREAAAEEPAEETVAEEPEREAAAEEPAEETVAEEPAPEPVAARPQPAAEPKRPPEPANRPGFFARLFGRRDREPAAQVAVVEEAVPVPRPAVAVEATPEPIAEIPVPPAPDPAPPAPDPTPLPDPPAPPTEPDPPPPTVEASLDPERTVAILTEVLDDLGAAHHRPFSRG